MFKKISLVVSVLLTVLVTGCASVPMETVENDKIRKEFMTPELDKAGLYIYRNTWVGQALKKTLYVDDQEIGESINKVYFYKELTPGSHKISTESEFSENHMSLDVEGGKNYFAEQYIKFGVFVGGANLKLVSESTGKEEVMQCELAKEISVATN